MLHGPVKRLSRIFSAVECSGIAAVEFALIAPIFVLILAGTIDLGIQIYLEAKIGAAVAAGAEYAAVNASSVNSANGASLASAIANVAANANGSGWENSSVVVNNGPSATVTGGTLSAGGTAANADSCYCPTGSPPNWSWGTAVACGSACTGGGIAGKFVTVTASRSVTPLFPAFNFVRGSTITQSALVQTQ